MQPHPTLSEHYPTPASREPFVRQLFDDTAVDYDRANAIFSLGSGRWYRRKVVATLPLDRASRVLDVAAGSGLLAQELEAAVGADGAVIALDPSEGMLSVARKRLRGPLVQARAEALPVADGSVDVVTMGYALRHVADLAVAFAEFHRVLRPGGVLLILEIGRPQGRMSRLLARAWFAGVVPALCGLVLPRQNAARLMQYFWHTIDRCVPAADILAELRAAGFEDVRLTTTGVLRDYRSTRR